MKQEFQQSNNLSSIMIYTGSSYLEAASALADRDYGHYIEDLGYLSLASDKRSYWSYYKTEDLMFADTKTTFSKIKDLYNAAYSYQTKYYDVYSDDLSIKTITGDNKSISRYHARYSYQDDLDNQFSNLVEYTATDLNNFLYSLNYQKFNKMSQYGNTNEVSSIRIGAKTFDWHTASDIAYTNVTVESTDISYFFAYSVEGDGDDAVVTYFYDANEYLASGKIASYTYAYEYVDNVYTYNHYYYGVDDYYTYSKKEYLPIKDTLISTISYQVEQFEDKYGNDENLYTYYMYDCIVDIPMTLTTKSIGTKKSTFEMRYYSEYDNWFGTGIPAYFNFGVVPSFAVKAYEDGTFGARINENVNIYDSDVQLQSGYSYLFTIDNEGDEYDNTTEFTILSPENMYELVLNNLSGTINLTKTGWTSKANHLTYLSINNVDPEKDELEKILGINDLVNLKSLQITNCNNLKSTPAISNLTKLEKFVADASNIESFKPADGVKLEYVSLPETTKAIRLKDVEFDKDSIFYLKKYDSLNSLTFDNVSGIDTLSEVMKWNTVLKTSNKLIPDSLIHLGLNEFEWENTPVSIMEDIKKFDLDINEGTISLVGTGNYGMLSREEYISMTKLYGVNAFISQASSEKVFPNLDLQKKVNMLQEWEYKFNMTAEVNGSVNENVADMQFDYSESFNSTENTNNIIAVNAIVGQILATPTLQFAYDEDRKSVSHTFSKSIDTKDTPYTNSAIEAGDVLLYNGDTIKIFTSRLSKAENKFNYIKLGTISNLTSLLMWFSLSNRDVVDITFSQSPRPEVVNNIIVANEDELTINSVDIVEDKEDVMIIVDVNNHEAEANKIKVSVVNDNKGAVKVTQMSETGEWPMTFKLEVDSSKALIPVFGSKEYTLKVSLDEKLTNTSNNYSVDLNDIIFTTIDILALSKYDKTNDVNDGGILTLDEDLASVDEDGILTINSQFARYDEETETLVILNEIE